MKPDPWTIEFEISVVEARGSLRMTIPKEIAEAVKIKKGDVVLVSMTDGCMLVRKKV